MLQDRKDINTTKLIHDVILIIIASRLLPCDTLFLLVSNDHRERATRDLSRVTRGRGK